MEIKLKEDFEYSPDGRETVIAKKGDILKGDPAVWAMNQKKGERVSEKAKKVPEVKVKKTPNKKTK